MTGRAWEALLSSMALCEPHPALGKDHRPGMLCPALWPQQGGSYQGDPVEMENY